MWGQNWLEKLTISKYQTKKSFKMPLRNKVSLKNIAIWQGIIFIISPRLDGLQTDFAISGYRHPRLGDILYAYIQIS